MLDDDNLGLPDVTGSLSTFFPLLEGIINIWLLCVLEGDAASPQNDLYRLMRNYPISQHPRYALDCRHPRALYLHYRFN